LNNLAVASWWHKFPNFKNDPGNEEGNFDASAEVSDEKYTYQQIDKDFTNVLPLFKNSIFNIENVNIITDDTKKKLLLELLDQETLVPTDMKKFVF
jgi:hypothetical protein